MKWHKAAVATQQVQKLVERYGIDQLTAAILIRRDIADDGEIPFVLGDELHLLHNPFLFDEMERAIDRIHAARRESEKILIFGDRDADGITSIVLLVRTLRECGLEVDWKLPLGDEPYGLTLEAVERFAADDGSLIITVDCGATNAAEIERARALGIESIVIDHHNLQDKLPPAFAIINPKLTDSSYPFDGLCGCALAFKLRHALLYAESEHYKQPFCLLNSRPIIAHAGDGSDSPDGDLYAVELLKVVNMELVERLEEQIVPGRMSIADSRLAGFAAGCRIIVYDAQLQNATLRRIFGGSFDIELEDIAPSTADLLPAFKGKGLLQIGEERQFRIFRISAEGRRQTEGDILYRLFLMMQQSVLEQSSSMLDLVSMGTIADLMPMQNENRPLVRHGLRRLASTDMAGLRALSSRQKLLGRPLSARDVGFRITPVLNACGRLGRPDHAVRLLLTEDELEADKMAAEAINLNNQRRKMGEEAWHTTLKQARDSFEQHDKKLVFVFSPTIQRGITGILAGRFYRNFDVPAIVATCIHDRIIASMRSGSGFGIPDFLGRFGDILTDWGGHDAAGGFQLPAERLPQLTERIAAYISSIAPEPTQQVEDQISIDAEVPVDYLNPDLDRIVQSLGPFGVANPPLIFMSRALKIREISLVGRGEEHLRMSLAGGRHIWPAIFWHGASRLNSELKPGATIDLLFHLETNYYNNQEILRLHLLDVRQA